MVASHYTAKFSIAIRACRKYVPDFTVIAPIAPLTDTTKKGNPTEITWHEVRERTFQELKRRISYPPILKLSDVPEPFILQTDTSHIGIGAILLQKDSSGESGQLLLPVESCNLWTVITPLLNGNALPSFGE